VIMLFSTLIYFNEAAVGCCVVAIVAFFKSSGSAFNSHQLCGYMKDKNEWQKTETDIFWGEIAPCDHVVQIYENDSAFIDALTGFVGGGIKVNDGIIVIATGQHLQAVRERLQAYAVHVDDLIAEDRYIPLDAGETLSKFMVNNWPDEVLFEKTVTEILERARGNNRHVRAFGEMVALLWAKGNSGATVHLEHLWDRFCERASFCLFCAYPRNGFTNAPRSSMQHICGAHTKMIKGEAPFKEVHYKAIGARRKPLLL